MTKTRISVVHNLPAPYRLAIFEKLLDDSDLDARIFFTGRPGLNRPSWSTGFRTDDERIRYLPRLAIPLRGKSADKMNLNFSIGQVFSSKPDLVLLDGYQDPTNLLVAIICWIKKIPYVLSAEISYVWTSSLTGRLFNRFIAPVVRRAAYLTPSSRSCEMFFRHLGGSPSRMKIIPPLPDVQRLSMKCAAFRGRFNEIRNRLGLNGKFVVLYVGRFEDYKGIRELMAAMDAVISKHSDVCFVYVGNGSLESEVRAKCETNPSNSLFAGNVSDDELLEIYSVSDLHVMPSWHEAYGIVCAEALACGIPSIVTRTSGCSDLVVDGMNGFLVEPRDPEAISSKILAARSDPVLLKHMKGKAAMSLEGKSIQDLYASLKEVINVVRIHRE